MTILVYLIRCYIYIAQLICPNMIRKYKHKDSLELYPTTPTTDEPIHHNCTIDINNNINSNSNRGIINNNIHNLKTNYICGNCKCDIYAPQHMFSDKPFCTIQCRQMYIIMYNKMNDIIQ